jgi:GAF domain-containing protein/DNA-binding NarL/FixJ family response regulator
MDERIRLLLVDNDEVSLNFVCSRLREEDFEVMTATSGPDAVSLARSERGEFDVAVVDQVMGPPNGIDTMRLLHHIYPHIEVIITTAWDDTSPGAEATEAGAFRFIKRSQQSVQELVPYLRVAARASREGRRRQALQALVGAGESISRAENEEDLYRRLYDAANRLLPDLDGFIIARHNWNTGKVEFPFSYVRGKLHPISARDDANGIAEYSLKTMQPLILPEGDRVFREQYGLNPPTEGIGYCASKIVVPLLPPGQSPETINVFTHDEGVRYNQMHLEVLQAFANQAAVVKRNLDQIEEVKQLGRASAALARCHQKHEVLQAIVEQAHGLIGSDFTGLILHDPDGWLHIAHPVIPADYVDKFKEPRQLGGVTRWVIDTRQSRIMHNTHEDPMVKDIVRNLGIRSMLAMPLIFGKDVLGVLYAHTLDRRHFSDHDLGLWHTFAAQAAAALHSALDEEREIEEAHLLAQELGKLAGQLNMNETLATIADAGKLLFKSDSCRAASIDPPTRKVRASAWAQDDPPELRYEGEARCNGTTHWILNHKGPIYRSDAGSPEKPAGVPALLEMGLKSFAALPLEQEGRVIAVLYCNYYRVRHAFDERFRQRFDVFGAYAAQAIDRARRDAAAARWHELDRRVTTADDSSELRQALAEVATDVLDADSTQFLADNLARSSLCDPDDGYSPAPEAITAIDPAAPAYLYTRLKREMQQTGESVLLVNDISKAAHTSIRALRDLVCAPAFIAVEVDTMSQAVRAPGDSGILLLTFDAPTAFRREDLDDLDRERHLQDRLQGLLDQRSEQLAAMTGIFEAYHEQGDTQQVLNRIAAYAHSALGVHACTVLEYRSREGEFTQRGAAGLRHPRDKFSIPEGYRLFFGSGEPVIIPDATSDARISGSAFVRREGVASLIVYPLREGDHPIGLFFANYRTHHAFAPGEIRRLGLFADFTAKVLQETWLRNELDDAKTKLEHRVVWDLVSTIATNSRHDAVTKAATILNTVGTLEQLLAKAGLDPNEEPRAREALEQMACAAKAIANMEGRVPKTWEREAFPLGAVVRSIASRGVWSMPSGGEATVEVRCELDELEGLQVRGHRQVFIAAIEELMRNARQAVSNGGQIVIRGQRNGSHAELRISNTGRAVPHHIRDKLFREPVVRDDDPDGVGIGALLVAFAMEQNDGRVALESDAVDGTSVVIRLRCVE